MKRYLPIFCAVLGAAGLALADVTYTLLSTTARVDRLCISRTQSTGQIDAEAFGNAATASGGYSITTPVRWTLSGTASTQAAGLLDGQALTRWKAQEGL